MTDEYYLEEAKKSKEKGASKEHVERMEFLSKGVNVKQKISKWVNGALKGEHWFYTRKDRKIILHKAIQQGIQIALDIINDQRWKVVEEWKRGFGSGSKSVFEFLEHMGKISNQENVNKKLVEDLQKEFEDWCKCDEYTKKNGDVVKRFK